MRRVTLSITPRRQPELRTKEYTAVCSRWSRLSNSNDETCGDTEVWLQYAELT